MRGKRWEREIAFYKSHFHFFLFLSCVTITRAVSSVKSRILIQRKLPFQLLFGIFPLSLSLIELLQQSYLHLHLLLLNSTGHNCSRSSHLTFLPSLKWQMAHCCVWHLSLISLLSHIAQANAKANTESDIWLTGSLSLWVSRSPSLSFTPLPPHYLIVINGNWLTEWEWQAAAEMAL